MGPLSRDMGEIRPGSSYETLRRPWKRIRTYISFMTPYASAQSFVCAALLAGAGVTAAKPAFQELLFNPHWYRTFEATSSITPAEGTLLYAWDFTDPENRPDSFFVGIDTLWGLPQDQDGDTASDWDLQVCPDEICMNGLKAGIHGANSPYPFDGTAKTRAEHHFQYFPAIDKDFAFTAPARSLFGAMMFCRSRSTGASDTVFAFGSWNLKWDSAFAPPVRPVAGYLPRLADFAISGDTVRYLKAGSGIARKSPSYQGVQSKLLVRPAPGGLRLSFPGIRAEKEIEILALDGRPVWNSGMLPAGQSELLWRGSMAAGARLPPGFMLVRMTWSGGEAWAKAAWLLP
jgi:hypothetical protein